MPDCSPGVYEVVDKGNAGGKLLHLAADIREQDALAWDSLIFRANTVKRLLCVL